MVREYTLGGMTVNLIRALKRVFPDNRLTVFGVSWGSLLATHAAVTVPDDIDEVVAYGQITRDLFANDAVFAALDAANLNTKERARLDGIDKAHPTSDERLFLSQMLNAHTEALFAHGSGLRDYADVIIGSATSPDYGIRDFKALFTNGTSRYPVLVDEMFGEDLRPELARVSIPYYVIQGEKDLVTPTPIVREDLNAIANPNIHYEQLYNSAHFPSQDALAYVLNMDNCRV